MVKNREEIKRRISNGKHKKYVQVYNEFSRAIQDNAPFYTKNSMSLLYRLEMIVLVEVKHD